MAEDLPILKTITLWDSEADPLEHEGLIYSWNGYAENASLCSLLWYIDTHSKRLRQKYLAWIHDFGEYQINSKRIIDHLVFEDGLSYWWMTLFVEKAYWKSPAIFDVIRLFAFEEIVADQKPGKIRLVSTDPRLHEVIKDLCQNQDISYEWEQIRVKSSRALSLRAIAHRMPQFVQALLRLICYIWTCWPLRRAEKVGWFGGVNSVFFCSYFFNIDPKFAEEGCFRSHYWEGLNGLMRKLGISGNWLQHYPHNAVPKPQVAVEWVNRFNQKKHEEGYHVFLDSFLSWRIVLRVIKRWIKLLLLSCRLKEIKPAFKPSGSGLSLWPIMNRDWFLSMCGPVAINNLLWIELFDRAFYDLPHQDKGFFLCENMGWERALIHFWRKYNHGQLIGVAHNAGRFWDLRYFNDLRTTQSVGPYSLPQADLTALNGKMAVDAYLDAGCPKEAIVECEALHFGYLSNPIADQLPKKNEGSTIRVLILGDYLPKSTTNMLQLLKDAVPYLTADISYTVKPHPNCPVKEADYPSLNLQITMSPLGEILYDFDIAYSSNGTSAILGPYLSGLPSVVILDRMNLNLSHLRGQPGACFVSTPKELAAFLQKKNPEMEMGSGNNDIYFLDSDLSRWKRLVSPAKQT